jgi:hypothetical protein
MGGGGGGLIPGMPGVQQGNQAAGDGRTGQYL